MNEGNTFELVLKTAASLPAVRIDRDKFLARELRKFCAEEQVELAITNNPACAGISVEKINRIAKGCINYETNQVSTISFVAGLPGGVVAVGAVTADLAQYFGHILRILQKLIYLYGWEELFDINDDLDDETMNLLMLFIGVMFGVDGAAGVITRLSSSAAKKASKSLAQKALTKGTVYPIVKKIAIALGIKMNKEIFADGVSRLIPVVGGVASGGLTYFSFKPCAKKLKKYLATLKWCDVNYYKNL